MILRIDLNVLVSYSTINNFIQFLYNEFISRYSKGHGYFYFILIPFLDYDECCEDNGGCEQSCVNFVGGYKCACDPGFELNVDKKTCVGKL